MMETVIWLGIAAVFAAAVWLAAPHHQRMIERRNIQVDQSWD
jgi:hypothetical protein